jgi:hypothetical protein
MAILPRPVSPRSALADLWDLLSGPRAHKWPLLALSMTMTGLIIWAFYTDAKPKIVRDKEIIYVESWMNDRRDSDVIRKQKADLARYEVLLAAKQKEFQAVATDFGIEWQEDAARNKARRTEVLAAINKQLDERLAKALAEEAREGKTVSPAGTP